MAPPRRVRGEFLLWRKAGEPDRELCKDTISQWIGEQPSQRHFQVSPDARTLAYTDPQSKHLHLLRRGADEFTIPDVAGNEIRFAPFAPEIAVVRGNSYMRDPRVIERVDLRRFQKSIWAELREPRWIEYCKEGLVVLHQHSSKNTRTLSLLPWKGEMRALADTGAWTERFTTGKSSNRIVYFDGMNVFCMDTEDSAPRKCFGEPGKVRNAEMTPDGQRLLFATDDALYLAESEGEPRLLTQGERVHSLWFSRDGAEFAWASDKKAVWQGRGETRELLGDQERAIFALRFCPASPGLLVCRDNEVLLWNPEQNQEDVLSQVDAPKKLIGADLFYGGMVIWAAEPWEYQGPRFKGNPFD